jgi:hypothetical protein
MPRVVTIALFIVFAETLNASKAATPVEWTSRLDATSKLLEKGEYTAALPMIEKLCDEIIDAKEPGSDVTRSIFGRVLTQRAIAEAGIGHPERALWYWAAAQNIHPQLAASDLSAWSQDATALLRANLLPKPLPHQCPDSPPGITPSAVRKTIPLNFPEGARRHHVQGLFAAEVTIDEEGRPSNPRVIAHLPATMEYAALESIRQWEFTPALKNGVPIRSEYCAAVNFRLNHAQ